jgi:hypothetical protein
MRIGPEYSMKQEWNPKSALDVARKIVAQELRPGAPMPADEEDLVRFGLIDSMGWVGILTALEDATEIRSFGNSWPEGRPQSIRGLAEAICEASQSPTSAHASETVQSSEDHSRQLRLVGWCYTLGSRKIQASMVERECGLATGTISERAGIKSVCRADESEDEVSLGFRAAEAALNEAGVESEKVDALVATSATWLALPSLAARVHSRLLLREGCPALDVGGACVGVIYALAAARSILTDEGSVALVVASQINSRRLATAPGEFRGLFGDGACAFVLSRSEEVGPTQQNNGNTLGSFV